MHVQCDKCSWDQRSDLGQIGVLFCKIVLVGFVFLLLVKDKMYIQSTKGRK